MGVHCVQSIPYKDFILIHTHFICKYIQQMKIPPFVTCKYLYCKLSGFYQKDCSKSQLNYDDNVSGYPFSYLCHMEPSKQN